MDFSTVLVLLTALKGRVIEDPPTEHLVHAVCNYRAPPLYIASLFQENTHFVRQLSVRDDQGKLPLHYAVQVLHLQSFDPPTEEHQELAKTLSSIRVTFLLHGRILGCCTYDGQ